MKEPEPVLTTPEMDTKLYTDTNLNTDFSKSVKNKMDDDLMAINQGLKVLDFDGKGQTQERGYFDVFHTHEDIRGICYGEEYTPSESKESDDDWERIWRTPDSESDQKIAVQEQEHKEQPQKDYQHEM
mgnify:FL=1